MATDLNQSLASKQGRVFKDQALRTIQSQGWTITRVRFEPSDTYPEVDFEGRDEWNRVWWFHARGSWRGTRPGLIRSDTTRKLLAVVYDLAPLAREQGVFQGVVTSHLPEEGASGYAMLRRAVDRSVISGLFAVELEDLEG